MYRLKKRDGVKWFAQTASTFLLGKVKQRKSVKVQARTETLNIDADGSDVIRKNDIKIFDCCCYFRTKGNVILASADKNLCIECEKESTSELLLPTLPERAQQRMLIDFGDAAGRYPNHLATRKTLLDEP